MDITFDTQKSEKNRITRNLPFELVSDFEWELAVFAEDTRFTYPEKRFIGIGYLYKRLHVICFTNTETGIRVISFRKANKREVKKYEKIHQKTVLIND